MAEATGEPNPVTPGSPVLDEPQTFVQTDGTFKEGWVDALVPEDLRHLGDYKPITTVAQLAREFGHAKTLIGRQGKGIMPLSKDAGPTEKAAYYKALGRPEVPGDYEFDIPAELDEVYADTDITDIKQVMHDLGLTKEQAKGVMAYDAKRTQDAMTKLASAQKSGYDDGKKVLRAEWGDAFDQKMHLAHRVIEENVPADQREELLEKWGNDLDLVRVLATMGASMLEDSLPDTGGAGKGAMTPDELEAQARELIQSPGYIDGRLPEATRERIRKESHALFEKARLAREGAR
ncbi:MAG: hypothetical protein IMZ62_10480 [Chloroflexi bacterium]|nr:hypothetical protein [Chloroflexota bacterium]MBE3117895.1 hypothetical protein [Candidatus Atribacteria bacterium]